jgi:glycosyltransferase involved in cell wall biosynthesis
MADHRAPLLTRTPFTLTIHDLAFLDHPEWFPSAVVRYKRTFLRASLLRGPRAVICVSEHTRSRLRAHHPAVFEKAPVPVIYSGMDAPGSSRPSEATSLPVSADGYFLTVSSIEPRKNHLGLLAAYTAAREAGLALRWIVVGSELYRSEPILRALRSAEGVEIRGRASDSELERLYRGARFVATPSFEEGFGYPPLEAMARGTPVVCSTGSAIDEIVGDAALRVPADDARAWTEALLRLDAETPLREGLIRLGRDRAATFTWERASAQYADTFRDVLRQ